MFQPFLETGLALYTLNAIRNSKPILETMSYENNLELVCTKRNNTSFLRQFYLQSFFARLCSVEYGYVL